MTSLRNSRAFKRAPSYFDFGASGSTPEGKRKKRQKAHDQNDLAQRVREVRE